MSDVSRDLERAANWQAERLTARCYNPSSGRSRSRTSSSNGSGADGPALNDHVQSLWDRIAASVGPDAACTVSSSCKTRPRCGIVGAPVSSIRGQSR